MRNKIRKSMYLVVFVSLAICYGLIIAVIYQQTLESAKMELEQEAEYVAASLEFAGEEYLQRIDEVQLETRVTYISADGEVLYDSGKNDETTLENHSNRKEVQDAFTYGTGEDVRRSDTIGESLYYYAIRMDDGNVLRVARNMGNVWHTAIEILPQMIFIAGLMSGFAWILANRQVAKLIQPINELNLEEPLENNVYEELQPLLERLDKQNKEKEKVEQMRKEFSANVSHELKTPLTSISGYAEIMKEGIARPEDMKKFAERIYNEASRMITLVGDIIKLSKLDEGNFEMEKETVDIYQMTRDIISRLAMPASKKKVHFELVGEPVIIEGIPHILQEMVYNLCENAIKYNVENGSVYIWIGQTLSGKKIIIEDTGIGIPKEHHDRIFERFYRVDKSHSRETGGTGLGLSIVKHGALLHDAEITLDSEKGKGTRIELTF